VNRSYPRIRRVIFLRKEVHAFGGGVGMVELAALKFLIALIVLITINSVTRSLVSWSLTSLFSTNMAISETKLVH